MSTFNQSKVFFVLYLRLFILFSLFSQFNFCEQDDYDCFNCGLSQECYYESSSYSCLSYGTYPSYVSSEDFYDSVYRSCSSFFNSYDQEKYCGEIYQTDSTNYKFRMPSYEGLYGTAGLFCQYKIYPEFENTKISLSFYNGLAHVFKTDVDRHGFQRTTSSYEDVNYDVNKASRLHLIIYFEKALSYKPFDLVITDYTESEDYYQEPKRGLIAGITTICIVFAALVVILIVYCCCCKKEKTSQTFTIIQRNYKFKPINPETPGKRVILNENNFN